MQQLYDLPGIVYPSHPTSSQQFDSVIFIFFQKRKEPQMTPLVSMIRNVYKKIPFDLSTIKVQIKSYLIQNQKIQKMCYNHQEAFYLSGSPFQQHIYTVSYRLSNNSSPAQSSFRSARHLQHLCCCCCCFCCRVGCRHNNNF